MDFSNTYIIAPVLVGIVLVAFVAYLFLRKRSYSEEEKSWRRAIAISIIRLSKNDFIDRSKIAGIVGGKTNPAIGKKFQRIALSLSQSVTAADIKDEAKFEEFIAEIERTIDRIGLSSSDLFRLALALWDMGIAGYGVPVDDLISDERLLTPILYRLAQGDSFHSSADAADELKELKGLYYIFSKNAGQENISRSILFIAGYQTHEEIKKTDGGAYRDSRAVAFEISKDPRFQNPIIRGGTFIPFLPQSMAFLSLRSKVCDDLRAGVFEGLIDPEAKILNNPAITLDESFKYLSLERRPSAQLRGTFLNRDMVGKLVGIKFRAQINDDMLNRLGLLNNSEIEQLHELERIAVDELRTSFDVTETVVDRCNVPQVFSDEHD